jgi:hypothetical protein
MMTPRYGSLTTGAPVPGSPTARELALPHVTLRLIARPVTLIAAVAGPGRFELWCFVPV